MTVPRRCYRKPPRRRRQRNGACTSASAAAEQDVKQAVPSTEAAVEDVVVELSSPSLNTITANSMHDQCLLLDDDHKRLVPLKPSAGQELCIVEDLTHQSRFKLLPSMVCFDSRVIFAVVRKDGELMRV